MKNNFSLSKYLPALAAFLGLVVLYLPALVSADGGISFKLTSFIGPKSAEELLETILEVFIIVATPIIVLFIIYAGFLYVTAQGNAQQVQQATRALTYSIIGAVLIIGAVAISQIVKNVVQSFE